MLFREVAFADRPAAAAQAGFRTVESWWPEVDEGRLERWVASIRTEAVSVACLNCYAGDLAAGERGFLNVPVRHDRTIADFEAALRLARRIGAQRINVLVGRRRAGSGIDGQRRQAVAVLQELAAIAEPEGVSLLVEPINELDIPGSLVPTVADAVALVEAVGSERVELLYDAYHIARAGDDPFERARKFVAMSGHVQYADCPGRGAPGTGQINLRRFLDVVGESGYDGAVGLEFDPHGSTEAALESVSAALARD